MSNPTLIKELLAEHKAVKATADKAKDKERKLRDKIVALLFPNAKRGTNKTSFKDLGLDVKAVIKEAWSVKQDGLQELFEDCEALERAFKKKFDLSITGYKSLSDDEKQYLAHNVTCKDAAPELSYEGELGRSNLSDIKTEHGNLYVYGLMQSEMEMDLTAKYYGFQHGEQLVKFLEEIQ